MNKGYVYLLVNDSMPGLIKIGRTMKDDIQDRIAELDTTGVPLPFKCYAFFVCKSMSSEQVETMLHTAFGTTRVRENREFFRKRPEDIVELIRNLHGVQLVRGAGLWNGANGHNKNDNSTSSNENEKPSVTRRKRRPLFSFEKVGIGEGQILTFTSDPSVTAVAKTGTDVEFKGEVIKLGDVTRNLLDDKRIQFSEHWKHNDVLLKKLYDKAFATE